MISAILLEVFLGWLACSPPGDEKVLIEGVPHLRQEPDFCGEACAAMFLRKLGKSFTQDDVYNFSGLDPILGRGCRTPELARALQAIGFKTGEVWHTVSARKAEEEVEAHWRAVLDGLRRGIPSIICMRYDERPGASEHFRLVLGFDPGAGEVIYHEPAEEDGGDRRMKKELFLELWPLKYEPERWTLIRMPLQAGDLKEPRRHEGFSPADFAQHVLALKKKLPGRDFSISIQPPFVVIGDEPEETVRARAENTVKWAADKLKQAYFKKDPKEILDVWLFKDDQSYKKYTRAIFNDTPSTPFGYYSSEHRALIMNIGTGGGTLVHEMVHPFMEANFPGCPAWFNEGLASLYEQCGEKDGRIHGNTNWRLEGLQKAIREGSVPGFEKLTGTNTAQFYQMDKGTNYAQARYLCYYLQEKGRLGEFYRQFLASRGEDPSGYETLKKVLNENDMQAFQKRWEEFVLKLRFP